ncbi:MAG: MraY family glycosyltransferase [Myxococcales bacterium]|nr:undecaprenyl/decaprenyl-phosphate alpha-N-acetylglucosaminyl 1-phosphate transferase [Polyangiaceae bacterium]MDW8249040.1 MraY family glycosyltransferase [Myxococcales bacterium]
MLSLQLFLSFTASLVCSLALTPVILRIADALKLYDVPDAVGVGGQGEARRVHTRPTPRLGGVAIVGGFFMALLFSSVPQNLGGVYLASLVMFLTGLTDDLRPLSAKVRLLIQAGTAAVAVAVAGLGLPSLSLTTQVSLALPPVLGWLFGVFVIVGSINAVNMIDGLDGLAGGVVLIGVLFLSYLHFLNTGDLHLLLVLSLPIIGGILGFLKYNTHPASVFMGDGGSNWLGFMTGVLFLVVARGKAIHAGDQGLMLVDSASRLQVGAVPLVTVVLCLSVPIFDTAWVILSRLRAGVSPMTADKRHFHHGLMKLGLSHSQSVMAVYFVTVVFAVMGVLPVAFPAYRLGWAPYVSAALLFLGMPLLLRLDEGLLLRLRTQRALFSSNPDVGPRLTWMLRIWETSNRYIIYGILMVTPVFAGVPPRAVGLVAAFVLPLLLLSVVFSRRKADFLDSVAIAFAATVVLIANNANTIWILWNGQRTNIQFLYNYVFLWLAVSTLLLVVATFQQQYFLVTPSDFLMILLPLVLLLVPEPYRSEHRLNIIGLRSLVLFAAIRTMQKRHRANVYRMKMLSSGALLYVILVSLFGLRVVY